MHILVQGPLSGILQVGFAGVDGISQTREMATKGAAWCGNFDDEFLFAESHKLSGGRVVATSVIRGDGDGIV